ncbi:MAG: hypothetical protein K0R03_1651 [Moraxellaceae bacterium]|jgi:hypothetical protein|nr:hypothetical protein [Moraxellaceae bacterium]MDF3031093.1 hypothetical protein [Moraxellaceae bacterium]
MEIGRSDRQLLGFMAGVSAVAATVWWIGQPATLPAGNASGMATPPPVVATRVDPRRQDLPAAAAVRRISGEWVGWLTVGATPTEFRFSLQEYDGRLSGTVRFPVGDGIVQAGSLSKDQVNLVTLNPMPDSPQGLQTQFSGTYAGDVMHLVMQTEAGYVNLTLQRAL